MSSAVSYANIAANGKAPLGSGEKPKEVHESAPVEAHETASASASASASAPASDSTSDSTPSKETDASKEVKKALAPAPVPAKSAWGSTSNDTSGALVDEYKWPTPDKPVENVATNKPQQKFIKPITNKWVPISAKVILPSPRTQPKQRQRKQKTKSTPKKNGHTKKDDAEENDDTADAEPASDSKKESIDGQKNKNRRHNSTNSNSNKRYSNSAQGGIQQFQGNGAAAPTVPNGATQNGFFHPQPFVQNQYFNNRQFRPQNGQFRPHRNYNRNGYRSSPQVPYISPETQIPPPISPKQDPQQALTHQIDYYFSLENLIRDVYLRKNMDTQGWVALSLILNFKRVKIIINGIQNSIESDNDESFNKIILESIKGCQNLEIGYQDGKDAGSAGVEDINLRVKDNFSQWLLPAEKK